MLEQRYRLEGLLGQGGMGTVYRAFDRLTGQRIALKRMRLDNASLDNSTPSHLRDLRLLLTNEFQVMASLRHPHIIGALDYGFDADKAPYYTMMLLEDAENISNFARHSTLEEQVLLIVQMFQALAYLHRHGVLHHDLKPANVLVTAQAQVKVVDFGLARNQEKSTEITGTIAYLAPELLRGKDYTLHSDLYSAGLLVYEIFTGTAVINNQNVGKALHQILYDYPPFDILPVQFQEIVRRLLAKNPDDRYQNAEEVIDDFSELVSFPTESAAIRESYLQAARFVGREKELALLENALQASRNKHGQFYLITGESGIGKSRLLEEMRIQALIRGMQVLRGQAGSNLPYSLWRDVLPPLLLSVEITDFEAGLLQEIIPNIASLLERPIPPIPPLDNQAAQQRLLLTILGIFKRLQQPTLLLLEDLHLARESLLPLRQLQNEVTHLPLVILGTYRDDERPELIGELSAAQVLKLERLNASETAELCNAILGDSSYQADLLERLQLETEGNAFFIVETLRSLAEKAGRLSILSAEDFPEQVLTQGIQAIIEQRLAQVPMEFHDFLNFAALTGRRLDLKLLAHLVPTLDFELALYFSTNASVLVSTDGNWQFAHEKIRYVLLQAIPEVEQAPLYQRLAEALEALYAHDNTYTARLFSYWEKAGQTEKAAHYAVLHAQDLLRVNRFKEAQALLQARSESQANPLILMQVLKLLGEATFQQSQYALAEDYLKRSLDLAQQQQDLTIQAESLIRLGSIYQYRSDYAKSFPYYEQCFEHPDRLLRGRALHGYAWSQLHSGNAELAELYAQKSLALFRAIDYQIGIAHNLTLLSKIATGKQAYKEAQVYAEESLATQKAIGNRKGIAGNLDNLGEIAIQQGDYALAATYYQQGLEIGREIGHPLGVAFCLSNLARVRLQEYDLAQADSYAEEALAMFSKIGNRQGMATCYDTRGQVAFQLGIFASAKAFYRQSLELAQAIGARQLQENAEKHLHDLLSYEE